MRTENEIISSGNEVLEKIDFMKIRCCMSIVGWEWIEEKDVYSVPTIKRMKDCVRELMQNCYESWKKNDEKVSIGTGTGGFDVELDADGVWWITFTLENQDTE